MGQGWTGLSPAEYRGQGNTLRSADELQTNGKPSVRYSSMQAQQPPGGARGEQPNDDFRRTIAKRWEEEDGEIAEKEVETLLVNSEHRIASLASRLHHIREVHNAQLSELDNEITRIQQEKTDDDETNACLQRNIAHLKQVKLALTEQNAHDISYVVNAASKSYPQPRESGSSAVGGERHHPPPRYAATQPVAGSSTSSSSGADTGPPTSSSSSSPTPGSGTRYVSNRVASSVRNPHAQRQSTQRHVAKQSVMYNSALPNHDGHLSVEDPVPPPPPPPAAAAPAPVQQQQPPQAFVVSAPLPLPAYMTQAAPSISSGYSHDAAFEALSAFGAPSRGTESGSGPMQMPES